MLVLAFAFGFFQALMPMIGWLGASTFSHLIESVDHWIAFGILAFLGGRMIRESFKNEELRQEFNPHAPQSRPDSGHCHQHRRAGRGHIVCLFGHEVGDGHYLSRLRHRVCVVRALAASDSCSGYNAAAAFARRLKAELWGGIILVGIGTKILIEHLFLG